MRRLHYRLLSGTPVHASTPVDLILLQVGSPTNCINTLRDLSPRDPCGFVQLHSYYRSSLSPRHFTSRPRVVNDGVSKSWAGIALLLLEIYSERGGGVFEERRVPFVVSAGPPGCNISIDVIIPIPHPYPDGFKTASTAWRR